MDLGPAWAEAGLWGLLLASFLAATVLPFSSEALLGLMALGEWSTLSLLIVASVGNTLGGLTNYGIGRWVPEEKLLRRLRVDPTKAERWRDLIRQYGVWTALLCWLPVIGDPIAIALGLFRAPLLPSALLMLIGKTVRYAVLLAALRGALDV